MEGQIKESDAGREGVQEMQEALLKLQNYLNQGYVLHGGKNRLEIIEPRQARDDDPTRMTGNMHGVYAEDQDVRIPIFMALKDRRDKSKDFNSFYHGWGPENEFIIGGENIGFTPGYVCVLPKDSFKRIEDGKGNYEFVSEEPVRVTEIISVNPSILDILPKLKIEIT